MEVSQGDIIRLDAKKQMYIVVSKNAFIRMMGVFYVCPFVEDYVGSPMHLAVVGQKGAKGMVICENIKLIDPMEHSVFVVDSLKYRDVMESSDIIQGMFEYD